MQYSFFCVIIKCAQAGSITVVMFEALSCHRTLIRGEICEVLSRRRIFGQGWNVWGYELPQNLWSEVKYVRFWVAAESLIRGEMCEVMSRRRIFDQRWNVWGFESPQNLWSGVKYVWFWVAAESLVRGEMCEVLSRRKSLIRGEICEVLSRRRIFDQGVGVWGFESSRIFIIS
jgi:hypothetical protein